MADPWPASLPQELRLQALVARRDHNVIRTPFDGPSGARRKFTHQMVDVEGTIVVDDTQYGTLETFYYTTLSQVKPFDWKHPITGATKEFRFRSPPSLTTVTPMGSVITLQLEMINA